VRYVVVFKPYLYISHSLPAALLSDFFQSYNFSTSSWALLICIVELSHLYHKFGKKHEAALAIESLKQRRQQWKPQ